MFTALGDLVETLAGGGPGAWLGAFFRERLWAPMGMDEKFLKRGDPRFREESGSSHLVLADGYYWRRNRSCSSSSSNDNGKRGDGDGGKQGEYVKRPRVPADWDDGAAPSSRTSWATPRTCAP